MDDVRAACNSCCVAELVRVCQVIAGDILSWPTWPDLKALPARFAAVPPAASYAEATVAVAALLQFTNTLGERVHRRLHGSEGVGACQFKPEVYVPSIGIDRAHPQAWTVASAVGTWSERFSQAAIASHDLTIDRAKERIERDLAKGSRLRDLSTELACSVPVLQRRFVATTCETYTEYRIRVRTIKAVRLIRSTSWKMAAIAREVGWKSRKDLYRALAQLAGLTPGAIRRLTDSEADALLARMAAPQPRWDRRSPGTSPS
jgi:AraC-like DNA-binding protein